MPNENTTEYIRCEHCKNVFDHDATDPHSMTCPYCGGKITDASRTVTRRRWDVPNKKLMVRLHKMYPDGFNNAQAYYVYSQHHADRSRGCTDDGWRNMSVRNALCGAVRVGWIERVAPGTYEWLDITELTD